MRRDYGGGITRSMLRRRKFLQREARFQYPTKIGGVYSAGGQLILQEKPTSSTSRKKRTGLFGDPRYVVSKGQPVRGPAQRRQAEIRTRSRANLDWSLEESTEEKDDLVKLPSNEKALNICKGTLNGPIVQWKARRRAQLIPRAKLRAPLPNYQRLQLSFSSEKTEDDEPTRTRSKSEKRRKPITPIFQMEPQMIRVKEGLSPTSHLHSEKIRISGDAAIFEIKREIPADGTKFSSRYEIYNSTTKPFGKSYRELTLSSSTSGSSCESHTSSLSSSGLSETTTYITCSSEIEPVQMTGFQCIDETQEKHLVSIMNAENYDLHEATNYDIGYKKSSCDEAPIEKHYSTFYTTTTSMKRNEDEKPIIKTNTWSSRTHEPLKSPKLLKQMISNFETERVHEPPIVSTKSTYKEDQYTYEPELNTNVSKTVTRCRSMMNLELKPDTKDHSTSPTISKATSELDLQQESKLEEKKRITKTISIMLEKRRKAAEPEPNLAKPKVTSPFANHNDKLINENIILIESSNNRDRSCRVTGEILKNSPQSNYTDYHRAACTLPRAVKSHRSQLQRHFYYPQYVGKGTRVKDEELPDPDKVKSARELFERVLKIGSLENVNKPQSPTSPRIIYRPTPEIRQPADILARQKLQKCLSVDTSHPETICKWTDNGSLSSGVGSDISAETDIELSPKSSNGIDCGSKEDIIFTSDEDLSNLKDEELGKPISDDVLRNIRAFGTSVTYYGGKVIATSKGYSRSPMTMTIMNEIKKSSPDFHATRKFLFDDKHFAKFKLIKSNSCGSGLELSGTEEYGKEYEKKINGVIDCAKNDIIKREPEPIKEEDEPQEKQPTAKESINAIETKTEQRRQFYKNNKGFDKPYVDMEFEEFQVMEEKS